MTLHAGQIIVSPRGTRVEILELSGERISFKRTLPPLTGGTKSKAHRHTEGSESFELVEGEASGWIEGQEQRLKLGEVLTIPLGWTHVNPATSAGNTATILQTVAPCSRGVEVYFTSWVNWLAKGKTDANDEPTALQIGAIIREGGRAGTWASGIPPWLQRIALPILGVVATLTGTKAVATPARKA